MKIRSIRARLTIWYSILLSLTFLFLGGISYALLAYSLTKDVDTALKSVAGVILERNYRGETSLPPSDIDGLFRQFFGSSPWERFFGMFDPFGNTDQHLYPPESSKLRLSPEALKNATEGRTTFETRENIAAFPVRLLTAPVISRGRLVNVIMVGMSLENAYSTRHRFVLTMAAVFPVALIIAAGCGWLIARRALAPVDKMAENARRISMENLTERLIDPGGGDEVSRLAETLNDMLSRLNSSFSQIRQFSADASHELQTPLTILKGEIEVALRSARTPSEHQRILVSLLEEIERMARLVEALLLLARADTGVLKMDLKPVDLSEILHEVFIQGKFLADKRNINVSLSGLEPVVILGDADRLKRVFINLLDNAVKYTQHGGRVTVSLEIIKEWALITIEDTGIGISKEDQQKIFERFYRSSEARAVGGTGAGLGLCIAQSIIEVHKGRIELSSSPGSGSVFKVFLPL
ncbi:MAG: HAMP domain-containing protein [Proteobacteria bacterium]|nr:HAMP domain-containing protein [Pseudomonadota bacterium]MBU1713559.1 HAMP domain-containing protein [Pseudomonadota bacterium]